MSSRRRPRRQARAPETTEDGEAARRSIPPRPLDNRHNSFIHNNLESSPSWRSPSRRTCLHVQCCVENGLMDAQVYQGCRARTYTSPNDCRPNLGSNILTPRGQDVSATWMLAQAMTSLIQAALQSGG